MDGTLASARRVRFPSAAGRDAGRWCPDGQGLGLHIPAEACNSPPPETPGSASLPFGLSYPILALAPMVKQCDLPFRALCRRHGCTLVWTEMLMADEFAASHEYRTRALGKHVHEDDHPLIVQFAANDPDTLLQAAVWAQAWGADGVDLNLGCPQRRAKAGHYGAWLTDPEDWPLCAALVRACADSPRLQIPVSAKIRLQPEPAATVELARRLEAAGAHLLTVHGRQRGSEDRRRDGAADLQAIRQVAAAVRVPVVSNGNIRCAGDVRAALEESGCAGVMSAEQLLRDPALFRRFRALAPPGAAAPNGEEEEEPIPSVVQLAHEYCQRAEAHVAGGGEPLTVWCDPQDDAYVVKQHLKGMLTPNYVGMPAGGMPAGGTRGASRGEDLMGRSTFKRAATVHDVAACFRGRFRAAGHRAVP